MTTFGITRIEATREASAAYVAELDRSIDELTGQLELLQALRRATAGAFGFDRRGGEAGTFGKAADAAKRAIYEGEGGGAGNADGRMVPRGQTPAWADADIVVDINGQVLKHPGREMPNVLVVPRGVPF